MQIGKYVLSFEIAFISKIKIRICTRKMFLYFLRKKSRSCTFCLINLFVTNLLFHFFRRLKRILRMFHKDVFLSDSTVKSRWKKDLHCHFCLRICDSKAQLEDHLTDQEHSDCLRCYLRHYKTKVQCN